MSRSDAISDILRLLPSQTGEGESRARWRLENLTTAELERIRTAVKALAGRRQTYGSDGLAWDELEARVGDVRSLEVRFSQLQASNSDVTSWIERLAKDSRAITEASLITSYGLTEPQSDVEDLSHRLTQLVDQIAAPAQLHSDTLRQVEDIAHIITGIELRRRIALFNRVATDATMPPLTNYHSLSQFPTGAYSLLPMDWLRARIVALRRRFQHETETALTASDREDMITLLRALDGGTSVEEYLHPQLRDENEYAIFGSIVNTFWHVPIQALGRFIIGDLIRLYDVGARRIEADFGNFLSENQRVYFALIVQRAFLAISKIKVALGAPTISPRTRNLVGALRISERVGLLAYGNPALEPALLIELERCVGELTGDPDKLAQEEGRLSKFDKLLNAADVLRYAALVDLRFKNLAGQARARIRLARRYFDACATDIIEDAERRLLSSRRVRALLVEAEVAVRLSDVEGARAIWGEAVTVCEELAIEADASGIEYSKCVALVALARFGADASRVEEKLLPSLQRLTKSNPLLPNAWELLFSYYFDVHADSDKALMVLSRWAAAVAECPPQSAGRAALLTYRRTRLLQKLSASIGTSLLTPICGYIDALGKEPDNARALLGFLEAFEKADDATRQTASAYVARSMPDSNSLPWTHAIVRGVAALTPTLVSSNPIAAAYSALVTSSDDRSLGLFALSLQDMNLESRVTLEAVSKFYFRRGRDTRSNDDLIKADRLVAAGLLVKPNDIVWLSRRIDIALFRRDIVSAKALLTKGASIAPNDAILRLQLARLHTINGDPRLAKENLLLLARRVNSTVGDLRDVHPAVVDQLALTSLQLSEYDEAEHYYKANLDRQPLDPRSWIGLGRVCFERGEKHRQEAIKCWIEALVLNSASSGAPTRFAARTANLLASAIQQSTSRTIDYRFLDKKLQSAPDALSALIPACTIAKIPLTLKTLLRDRVNAFGDVVLHRKCAEMMRAWAIREAGVGKDTQLVSAIISDIAWCRERGVLAAYFCGARGAYARRALTELSDHGLAKARGAVTVPLHYAPLTELADLITREDTPPDYYLEAIRICRVIVDAPLDLLARYAIELTDLVYERVNASSLSLETILSRCAPLLGFCAPSDLGMLDPTNVPKVGVWADREFLRATDRHLNGHGWSNDGPEITRPVSTIPTSIETNLLARGGVFFRSAGGQTKACLNVLPDWARDLYVESETDAIEVQDN